MEFSQGGFFSVDFSQFFHQALHRQADDVGEVAFGAFDDEFGVFLGGVGTGFIEGVDFFHVVADGGIIKVVKMDNADFMKNDLLTRGQAQANRGADFVTSAVQSLQHGEGIILIARFAERDTVETHKGIGTDDDGVCEVAGYSLSFCLGVVATEGNKIDGLIVNFFRRGWHGEEFKTRLAHKNMAAWRGRGEYEWEHELLFSEDRFGGCGTESKGMTPF